MFETFLVGILISALMGLATGWVRYWMGFFVLFQGVIASLLIVWLVGKYAKKNAPTANPCLPRDSRHYRVSRDQRVKQLQMRVARPFLTPSQHQRRRDFSTG